MRELLVFGFVAFLTYLSTYLADLRLGLHAIVPAPPRHALLCFVEARVLNTYSR